MRIVSPACWRGGAEAAMWFIAATRRRGPAGGTGNPAGGFWRLPARRVRRGDEGHCPKHATLSSRRHKQCSTVKITPPQNFNRVFGPFLLPSPPPPHRPLLSPAPP